MLCLLSGGWTYNCILAKRFLRKYMLLLCFLKEKDYKVFQKNKSINLGYMF